MGKFNFAAFAIFALCLLAGGASSYLLNVTVEDWQGTKLYNTRVEARQGDTAVASAYADKVGIALMEVGAGTYFISPIRSPYPAQVVPVIVKENTEIKVVMNMKRDSSSLYGQVLDPQANWEGRNIYLLNDWKIASSGKILPGGYFLIPYVAANTYGLRLDDGTPVLSESEVVIPEREVKYLEVHVAQKTVAPTSPPELSAPTTADRASRIIATLRQDGKPLAGEKVSITTPSGTISATTDDLGRVSVNAASYGKYVFKWGTLSTTTTIPAPPQAETPAVNEPQTPAQPQAPILTETPQAQQNGTAQNQPSAGQPSAQQGGQLITTLGLAAIAVLMAFGAIAAGAFAYSRITKKGGSMPPAEKTDAAGAGKEEAQAEYHPKGHRKGKKKHHH